MDFDRELDARGLNCPLPILRTKKALTGMQSGQVLKVLATDPGAVKDFQTFSRQTGHELLSHAEANRSEEHTSELQSRLHLVCRLLLEKKKKILLNPVTCEGYEIHVYAGMIH